MFNKKSKKAPRTLQSVQAEFNQLLFQIGDLTYRLRMIEEEASKLEKTRNELSNKADALGQEGKHLHAKVQAELAKTAAQGTATETQSNDPQPL